MWSTVLGATVPLLSVLVGAALTYWLNVRTRRKNTVEDLFNAAIAATAVADASQHYISQVGLPGGMTETEYGLMIASMIRTGIENNIQRSSEAREAIARVIQYAPELRPYYRGSVISGDKAAEIISLLMKAKERSLRGLPPQPKSSPAMTITDLGQLLTFNCQPIFDMFDD
jgi:hypothetical protein